MRTCSETGGLMRSALLAAAAAALCVSTLVQAAPATQQSAAKQIERGRYLVRIAGCNDCHTPGYAASGGKVAEKDWLVGDRLGFSGPWGTTYAGNLRLLVSQMTQQQWLARARSEMRPPMPTPSLHHMRQDDLKAIYRYIASLGPKGEPAPAYLPPGSVPTGPAVVFPNP